MNNKLDSTRLLMRDKMQVLFYAYIKENIRTVYV